MKINLNLLQTRIFCAVALGSCVVTEFRAQVVLVPNALATNDGNTSLTTPVGGPTSVRETTI
jgi:hypothetical protein